MYLTLYCRLAAHCNDPTLQGPLYIVKLIAGQIERLSLKYVGLSRKHLAFIDTARSSIHYSLLWVTVEWSMVLSITLIYTVHVVWYFVLNFIIPHLLCGPFDICPLCTEIHHTRQS